MRRITRAVTIGAVLAASCLMGTGTVNAQPAEPEIRSSALVLRVASVHSPSQVRTVTLRCNPTGGTHPLAYNACADLAATRGNIAAVRNDQTMICTLEYNPVVATAWGVWEGTRVSYRQMFSNPCVLIAQKGDLYRF